MIFQCLFEFFVAIFIVTCYNESNDEQEDFMAAIVYQTNKKTGITYAINQFLIGIMKNNNQELNVNALAKLIP